MTPPPNRGGRGGRGGGRTVPLPLAQLVEDTSLYPRHAVDEQYVNQLVQALHAGANLTSRKPIVIDARTSRIVDGWHRVRAYRKVLGATGVVDCLVLTFDSEAGVRLYAVSANADHGRKLDRIDQVRSVLILEEVGVDETRIALALNIPSARVQTLRIRVAIADAPGGEDTHQTIRVVLKRPLLHFSGQHMTAQQAQVSASMPGTSFLLLARQLRDAALFLMINPRDARLYDALVELRDVLIKYLQDNPRPGDDDDDGEDDRESA